MPTDRRTETLFEKVIADLKAQVDAAFERGRKQGVAEGYEIALAAITKADPRRGRLGAQTFEY